MSQLSRPFQIALAAMVVLVMAWFVVLRGHSNSPGSSPEPSPAASQSNVYHGSAPGVKGLTSAIAKAHGAVTTSQQNAHELQRKSAQSSREATQTSGQAPTSKVHASTGAASTPSAKGGSADTRHSSPSTQPRAKSGAGAKSAAKPGREAAVQQELAHHKVVLLMFWNPKSADDREVRSQLHDLSRRSGRVAIHLALPLQVGDFGGYTRGVQVLQTPTVLIIDPKGQVTTLSGLTDARGVQQAIGNALHGGAGKAVAPHFTSWVHGSARGKFIGQAEAMCKHKHFYVARTKKEFAADLSKIATANSGFKAKLVKLAPASDRAYIGRVTDLGFKGLHNLSAAFASHNAWQARTLLFEGQKQLDQAYDGYQRYGITSCVTLSG